MRYLYYQFSGLSLQAPIGSRCHTCGQIVPPHHLHSTNSTVTQQQNHRRASDRFIKPAIPAPQPASPMDTSTNKE